MRNHTSSAFWVGLLYQLVVVKTCLVFGIVVELSDNSPVSTSEMDVSSILAATLLVFPGNGVNCMAVSMVSSALTIIPLRQALYKKMQALRRPMQK